MKSAKDIREVIKLCGELGWKVDRGSKHIKLYPPEGNMIVISHTPTSSDYINDLKKRMKRELGK